MAAATASAMAASGDDALRGDPLALAAAGTSAGSAAAAGATGAISR